MINNSEALILNSYFYGDTSLICNLFTKDYGRISIISKGARTLKNSNSALLQPLQYINVHYYFKPGRNIQILKEASLDTHFYKIQNNYTKLIYSYNILDVLNQVCKLEHPNDIIFRLAKQVLKKVNVCSNKNITVYYLFFLLQLLKYLGYQPILDNCSSCNIKLTSAKYSQNIGQLVCNQCAQQATNTTINFQHRSLLILNYLSNTHIDNLINQFTYDYNLLSEIQHYLLYYISFHVFDIKKLQSLSLIK